MKVKRGSVKRGHKKKKKKRGLCSMQKLLNGVILNKEQERLRKTSMHPYTVTVLFLQKWLKRVGFFEMEI